ncbi:hypothetical protein [Rhizobium leguminosarum]|uniref:Integral membrane protein n=1 Tax=Rhizobium leguminosarum TaxID=384 RepID=A0A7M3DTZ8_RHILE|nr:hypothetical protein [Rhizobium leguminosarum]MDV4164513.1 hypothetical protein [Rhizobium leguminosarum]MDV4174768.1 hypothetical protein [Rhizobium leguminosarum]TAY52168.1 hypothetical protein ELH90_11125 [Rhizobium leguminosarum]
MKAFFVVALSAAAVLSAISAEAQVDSGGFDARGICRRPEGCVVDHGQGGNSGPRNYRNFNGRNERDGRNDRERDNRRYRSQNRSDNFDAGTSHLVAGPEIGLGAQLIQIRV